MNYEKLEGKKLVCDEKFFDAISHQIDANDVVVGGCDYNIGISIVSSHDSSLQIECLPGPGSPDGLMNNMDENQYKELFDLIIMDIEEGVITLSPDIRWSEMNGVTGSGGMASCPYSA